MTRDQYPSITCSERRHLPEDTEVDPPVSWTLTVMVAMLLVLASFAFGALFLARG